MDLSRTWNAEEISISSNTSKNQELGFGTICGSSWMFGTWEKGFIKNRDPSIEYLELFEVICPVVTWIHRFRNRRIILFCDNISVVGMVNKMPTPCKNCMALLRILILKGMIQNVRIFACHLPGKFNKSSDWLFRRQIKRFKVNSQGQFKEESTEIPQQLWPISKLWLD